MTKPVRTASRLDGIEISLIRQIDALATPLSINLGIGEPNIEADATFRAMAGEVATQGSWRYTPNAGRLSLRKKIAGAIAPSFDPRTEVCITAGTQLALYAIFQAFVEAGDEVLVPNPGFPAYNSLTILAGATPVQYQIEAPAWRLDASSVIAKMTERTKLIVINSPSNPLGAVTDRATLATIAAEADVRGCVVVSDEVYQSIWYGQEPQSLLDLGRNVVVVGGLSKSHSMTGLRLGWAIAREELMTPIIKTHGYVATCASAFSQDLAERIFEAREWNAAWLRRVRARFREQRDAALEAIERDLGIHLQPPAGAFYAFVPVPTRDSLSMVKSLVSEADVVVIPGTAFGSAGEGFVRISYAASVDAIREGIARIGRYLERRRRD
ncbi:MAG TPA: pyridoxal phosphate-dependent aminotransferase [Thermoanaerobaculia bacterium]|nr:pyridoxal phosphate-dependent aminotransferase [Thermoanaerobaculia bacterium]